MNHTEATTTASAVDILFLHGLESGPHGRKARWLADHYRAETPALPTHPLPEAFLAAVRVAKEAIRAANPRLVIGSSYGGAVLLELCCSGVWAGPSLFLAQAGRKYLPYQGLPKEQAAIFIHGSRDELFPVSDSAELVQNSGPAAKLWEVDDEHRLNSVVGPRLAEAIEILTGLQPSTSLE